MDWADETKVSLLTIPRSDLEGTSARTNSDARSSQAPMMLLKLPKQWTVADLHHAHLVATTDSQVTCVVESKQCSFSVHRVETSNALVMVPPVDEHRPVKKHKSTTGPTSGLNMVSTRLLKKGGSGACFLELRPKALSVIDLLTAMNGCTYNPYQTKDETNEPRHTEALSHGAPLAQGRTVDDLASTLQCSRYEVERALVQIHAYAVPHTCPPRYARLAEEAVQECTAVIVATLAEVDDCEAYADRGFNVDDFVVQATSRVSETERYPDVDHVIRHCLEQLRQRNNETSCTGDGDDATIRLDVSKVAACVARRLFQTQTSPWDDTTLFSTWQSDLPGVGDAYTVHSDMLLGIAVAVTGEPGQTVWKYVPTERLPRDAAACMDALFVVKEQWLLSELEPYLTYLASLVPNVSQSELLLRYTKLVSEDKDGESIKYYQKK